MTISPILAMTLGTASALALAKILTREWHRVNEALHPQTQAPENVAREALPTLRRDPRTGIYRLD